MNESRGSCVYYHFLTQERVNSSWTVFHCILRMMQGLPGNVL